MVVASDISAMIMEKLFRILDAPVRRVGSLESAIPFMKTLEDQYLPKAVDLNRIKRAIGILN